MLFEQGYANLFRVHGIPVRAHWSLLLGFAYVSGARFAPGAWLGYFVLVLVHELGHAYFARRYRAEVLHIDIHGLGGVCVHEALDTEYESSVIAWGGVLGQLLLFLATLPIVVLVPIQNPHALEFLHVFLGTNLVIAAFNLLPIGHLDGAQAWRLPGILWSIWRERHPRRKRRKSRSKKTAKKPKAKPTGELRLVRDENGDFRFERDD